MSETVNATNERWWISNPGSVPITIGDIPAVPTIYPGMRENILRFADKETIAQSISLAQALKIGLLVLSKEFAVDYTPIESIEADEVS
jgi:hypothetical protein